MSWSLFLIPLTTAFSCWLVISLLVYCLFHPMEPVRFGPFTMQGILPAQRSSIATAVAKYTATEFLSPPLINEKFQDPSHLKKVMPIIESHLDEFLRNKLKKEMPIVGAFIGEKTITSLKKIFVAELEQLFPQIIGGFVSNLVTDLDLEQLIVRKLGEVPIRNVELAFRKNFATQLKIAMGIGALIGLLIGILTMLIIYLASG